MEVSLIIPVYNEDVLLKELISRVTKVLAEISNEYEILFVDDGSTDNTLKTLLSFREKDPNLKVLQLSRNFGHQAAYTAGLEYAKGKYIALMDGDLQDPPEVLRNMYDILKTGEQDIVYGKRSNYSYGSGKRFYALAFHKVFKIFSGMKDAEKAGNFSMMNRTATEALKAMPEKNRYLPGMRFFIGFKQGYIEYERAHRERGSSKMKSKSLFSLAADAIFSFSKIPIKLCLILGVIGVVVFFLAGLYTLVAKIAGFAVLGWSSTLLSIYFLGSIQLTFLGILGEYIFRTYKESQNRPVYFVRSFYE